MVTKRPFHTTLENMNEYELILAILEQMNNRLSALETGPDGKRWEDAQECRDLLKRLKAVVAPGQNLTPKYLNQQEAATFLGVTPIHMLRLFKKGEGPPRSKIGRIVRYRCSDIIQWVESQKGKSSPTLHPD